MGDSISQKSSSEFCRDYLSKSDSVICVTGAAGAGKTSFVDFIRTLGVTEIHEEGVRPWLSNMGQLDFEELSSDQYSSLQEHLLLRYEQSNEPRIYDRTPFDLLYYSRHVFDDAKRERVLAQCRALIARQSVFVFFPFYEAWFENDIARRKCTISQISDTGEIASEILSQVDSNRIYMFKHRLSFEDNLRQALFIHQQHYGTTHSVID